MFNKHGAMAGILVIGACLITARAEFYPQRIYKERSKTSLDFGWKFYPGVPSGTPSDSIFNDAGSGWSTVNIPHSASYDAPTVPGESNMFKGVCWYRKNFIVPPAKHTGKIVIEFEGAMQSADVWLNGRKLGTHDNSGFTWFSFDITSMVSLTGNNVLAVRLDNTFQDTIPPGRNPANYGYPDYYLFSGLYRDVWLVCTDKCYMPLYSQKISIPKAGASAASAQVRISTTVRNDDIVAKNVALSYVVSDSNTDSNNNTVLLNTGRLTEINATLLPGQSYVFETTCGPITNPHLWSPDHPYLYKVYTRVKVDGQTVDDYVDRFGVRWYIWTPGDGFALNGTTTVLRGASLHQSIGWIESALPSSRFFKEVSLVKEMGANLIRCAHFPRDPSFYNACDELGMLLMVEVPTWGSNANAYKDAFWVRLNNCMREMIEVGYNHPSIISWGLFNEPMSAFSGPKQIPLEAATAHAMDSTRYIYVADNHCDIPALLTEADIEGQNYNELSGPNLYARARIINTEYHQGWVYWCFRGDVNDNELSNGYAQQRWNIWTGLLTLNRTNKLAGAVMWSFNDYWSPFMNHPMGVVDHLRIPKAVFYYFRQKWTGVASETPVPGLTPTQLRLDSDMDSLIADSTDVAIITASFRDGSGTCVDTKSGSSDSIPVTFTVTGPADPFPASLTVKANAGKCALLIKSKNTPGAITVSASAPGLTAAPVTINAVMTDTSSLYFPVSVLNRTPNTIYRDVIVRQARNSLIVSFPSKAAVSNDVFLVNARGQSIACPVKPAGTALTIDTRGLAAGYYFLCIGKKDGGGNLTKKVLIAR